MAGSILLEWLVVARVMTPWLGTMPSMDCRNSPSKGWSEARRSRAPAVSMSSIMRSVGESFRAISKQDLMSLRPVIISAEISTHVMSEWAASHFAIMVFPVPGGPARMTPRELGTPDALNFGIAFWKLMMSLQRASLTSSSQAIKSSICLSRVMKLYCKSKKAPFKTPFW